MRWTVVALLPLAGLASCFFTGIEVTDSPLGATSKAASTSATASSSSGAGGMACMHASWPTPPDKDDPGPNDVDFVAAIRKIYIGEDNLKDGATVGYDLDKTCTCKGDGVSCLEPKGTTEKDHCDGPNGIDNYGAHLFYDASLFSTKLSSAKLSENANAGSWSVLIRVKDYNGKSNDSQVTVSLYPSPGYNQQTCVPMTQGPKWDGSDYWPVDIISLDKGNGPGSNGGEGCPGPITGYSYDNPIYVDKQGYVSAGTLVANLPESQLVISSQGTTIGIHLTAGFLTGNIEMGPFGYRIVKGMLTGRWKLGDVFKVIGAFTVGNSQLCTNNALYGTFKTAVCKAPDITASIGGPTTPCDAVSFATQFETETAHLGTVYKGAPMMSGCTPATDPANDSCSK